MIFRCFNPATDASAALARLNPFPPNVQEWMAPHYTAFPPENVVVAEDAGALVGCLHIFDGGFPWAILDGWYLTPPYRTLANALAMGRFAESELRRRGIPFYVVSAPTRLSRAMVRTGLTIISDDQHLLGRHL